MLRISSIKRKSCIGSVLAFVILGAWTSCSGREPLVNTPLLAIVQGTVVSAGGQPVSDVRVEVVVYSSGCAGQVLSRANSTTTGTGSYRVEVPGGRGGQACASVQVTPPTAVGLAAVTVDDVQVVFGSPSDSVRLDVTLQPL